MLIYLSYILGLFLVALLFFFLGKKYQSNDLKHITIRLEEKNTFLSNQLQADKHQNELLKQSYATEKKAYEDKLELVRQDNQELIARISIRETEYQNLKEKFAIQQKETLSLQHQFTETFENLAHKILEENSKKFSKQNQLNLESVLGPLSERILHFEQKVAQTHKESIDYHASLRQQIISLKEINHLMNQETINLTKALKGDNKMQGSWGEFVLARVLESSGLEKGREYEIQKSFISESGKRYQPDVIINLPDNKKLIIDSKVSLVAYERLLNQQDPQLKSKDLNDHLISLKQHIDSLSAKNYQDLLDSSTLNFVFLFIPIETAFSTALQLEPNLYTMAYDKNIIIVTPSTLLATLRTIETMWNYQKQQKNAWEIARQAGLLYDKFQNLIQDLLKVGSKLDDAQTEYQSAFNKLSQGKGNLLVSVEKLKKLGAKAKKSLDSTLLDKASDSE